jgi:Ion channel
VYVTSAILFVTFRRGDVDVDTLQAALCVYLMIGLMWVYVYALIALAAPGSFLVQGNRMAPWSDPKSRSAEFVHLLVFSFSTLTTSGLSDVTPVTGFARICATLEAVSGQVYLAVVVARLVGMQAGASRDARTTAEPPG